MEHHRKHNQHRQSSRTNRQKQAFFRQVFSQCSQKFSQKQFQFFIKCMIPHGASNTQAHPPKKKPNNQTFHQQKQPSINDINPNVLTMARKINFYQQKSVQNLRPEKKNKRILTTPTQRIHKQVRFNNYEDYTFYKKMEVIRDGLTTGSNGYGSGGACFKNKNNIIGNKMYNPQPLFYPFRKNQTSKTILNTTGKFQSKTKMRFQENLRFKYDGQDRYDQKQNSQFVPDSFIQIVRCKSNSRNIRCSKTGNIRKTLI